MQLLPFPGRKRHKVAFVLSGGASLGAAQVGMLQALAEAGARPDLVVGSSAGALNGAWIAWHYDEESLRQLEAIWRAVRRADLFPVSPRAAVGGLMGRRGGLIPSQGMEAFISRHLNFERLEQALVPLHVVTTDIVTGSEVVLSSGPALPALMASVAIPGIFAPVTIDGRALVDGGIANNTPISVAVALGADEAYVLPTGDPSTIGVAPKSALGVAVQATMLMAWQRQAGDIARFERQVRLHVLPTPRSLRTSPVDFGHSGELIDESRQLTREWLRHQPQARRDSQGAPHPGR
ncbi:MAG: hypothetical protein QOK05_1669 [Chloroflexota bacterium]|jgi:NTE family protein|nr:hypothetical protein [Chloroflexota bacterium]